MLVDNIRKEVDQGKMVGTLFVDLSKAFDTLSHAVLMSKLKSYGIKGLALKWFKDYLFNRKQFCVIDNISSNINHITCGVPQGSILGPVLFLLYFNDLELCLKYAKVIIFADDTVLYVSSKCFHVIENNLNHDLQNMFNYFRQNELVMNLKKGKSESMVFGTRKRLSANPEKLNLFYNLVPIVSTTHYKYLGTLLDQTLSMQSNFEKLYKTASGKLRLLASLRYMLSRDAIHQIYTAIILPAILYNCVVHLKLSKTQLKKLDSIDNRAQKLTDTTLPTIQNEMQKRTVLPLPFERIFSRLSSICLRKFLKSM